MPRRKLTTRIVESMVSSGKRAQIFDTEQRGLRLRISESGEKSFSVCYKHSGRMKRLTLGKFQEVDLADARSRAREALNKVAKSAATKADRAPR